MAPIAQLTKHGAWMGEMTAEDVRALLAPELLAQIQVLRVIEKAEMCARVHLDAPRWLYKCAGMALRELKLTHEEYADAMRTLARELGLICSWNE